MGLAASQARYLALTARNNDLAYEAMQINYQRLSITQKTQEIAQAYTDAMNNTLMFANTADGNKQLLDYDVITSQDPFTGLGMRIVDKNGNVVVPSMPSSIEVREKDESGNLKTTELTSAGDFISKYMTDLSEDKKQELSSYSLENLAKYYQENYKDSQIAVSYNAGVNSNLKNEEERYLYDDKCKDSEYLQKMLQSGEWILQRVEDPDKNTWETVEWQGFSGVSVEMDTSDDAAAEAEYNSKTEMLQKQDKLLDLRLQQIETEQKAVEKEMESVKNIISKNIEGSFKTFT